MTQTPRVCKIQLSNKHKKRMQTSIPSFKNVPFRSASRSRHFFVAAQKACRWINCIPLVPTCGVLCERSSYWSHRYRRWVSLGISHLKNHWSQVSTTGRLQTDPFGNPPKNHAWRTNFFSKVGEKFTRLSGLYAMAKIWLLYGHYLAIALYETQWKIECLCIARWWVTN